MFKLNDLEINDNVKFKILSDKDGGYILRWGKIIEIYDSVDWVKVQYTHFTMPVFPVNIVDMVRFRPGGYSNLFFKEDHRTGCTITQYHAIHEKIEEIKKCVMEK